MSCLSSNLFYVLGHRVGAHAGVLADLSDAGPALVGFPVLAEHQVGVDRQLAWVNPRVKISLAEENNGPMGCGLCKCFRFPWRFLPDDFLRFYSYA